MANGILSNIGGFAGGPSVSFTPRVQRPVFSQPPLDPSVFIDPARVSALSARGLTMPPASAFAPSSPVMGGNQVSRFINPLSSVPFSGIASPPPAPLLAPARPRVTSANAPGLDDFGAPPSSPGFGSGSITDTLAGLGSSFSGIPDSFANYSQAINDLPMSQEDIEAAVLSEGIGPYGEEGRATTSFGPNIAGNVAKGGIMGGAFSSFMDAFNPSLSSVSGHFVNAIDQARQEAIDQGKQPHEVDEAGDRAAENLEDQVNSIANMISNELGQPSTGILGIDEADDFAQNQLDASLEGFAPSSGGFPIGIEDPYTEEFTDVTGFFAGEDEAAAAAAAAEANAYTGIADMGAVGGAEASDATSDIGGDIGGVDGSDDVGDDVGAEDVGGRGGTTGRTIGDSLVYMANGGLLGDAARLQNAGRYGDSMLVHMAPEEVSAVNRMGQMGLGGLQSSGMTVNPQTGLPEMFSFKEALPLIAGVGSALLGLPPIASAALTGTATAISTGDVGKGILAGLGSWGLGTLMGKVGTAGAAAKGATPPLPAGPVSPSEMFKTANLQDRFSYLQEGIGKLGSKELPYSNLFLPGMATAAPFMVPGTFSSEQEGQDIRYPSFGRRQYVPNPNDALFSSRVQLEPPPGYRPGVDPQFSYFAQEGTAGEVVEEAMIPVSGGIMEGASQEALDYVQGEADVNRRYPDEEMMDMVEGVEGPSVLDPETPEEQMVINAAVLAVRGELAEDEAEMAINRLVEVFGPEAYSELLYMIATEDDAGEVPEQPISGVVKPEMGETTVSPGEIQGDDIIAGEVVNPVTGEKRANLRVGENEYISNAETLVNRAENAGLPPTPENGAMVMGLEEEQLSRMYS